jgi:hypothetical protein
MCIEYEKAKKNNKKKNIQGQSRYGVGWMRDHVFVWTDEREGTQKV